VNPAAFFHPDQRLVALPGIGPMRMLVDASRPPEDVVAGVEEVLLDRMPPQSSAKTPALGLLDPGGRR
jgi:hypothetical protein